VRRAGGKPERGRHRVRLELRLENRRLLQDRRLRAAARDRDVDGLEPGERLLHVARLALAATARNRDRRSERGMACERHLATDRPDAVAVVGAFNGSRLHEGGLGEPRLSREAQHRLLVDAVRIVDDRERVALQRRLREDVENRVREARDGRYAPLTSTSTASPWPPPEQIAAQPIPPPRRRSS
jgi:hypothetical protein